MFRFKLLYENENNSIIKHTSLHTGLNVCNTLRNNDGQKWLFWGKIITSQFSPEKWKNFWHCFMITLIDSTFCFEILAFFVEIFFRKKMKSFSPFQIYLCASIPDIIWCMHNGNSRKICANKKFLFIETSLAAYYLVITINMDATIKQPSLLTNLKMRFTLADIVCAP